MELFLPHPVIESKNLFNKNIPIWSNDFEIKNETLKSCSPSQPSAQICACFRVPPSGFHDTPYYTLHWGRLMTYGLLSMI